MDFLFRQEAIDAKRSHDIGSISVAVPLSRWMLTSLALAGGGAIVLFLIFGQYTRRENITGQLVSNGGLLNLTAAVPGSVSHVWVHDGQEIHRGDALVEISSEQDSVALGDTRALMGRQLEDQKTRLKVDLTTQQELTAQETVALSEKVALLQAQLGEIFGQLKIEKKLATSVQTLLERIEPLATKGYISGLQIQQQEAAMLDAQGQVKTLMRQEMDLQEQVAAAKQQLAQLPLDASTQRNDTERKLADINQSMAQNEMQRALVLRAPRDGVISAILLKEGQTVAAGQSLISILPAGSTLEAQLLVPSRAIGFIEPGSRVVLRYRAFPYQKFGQQYGRIAVISHSALSPSEIMALTGQAAQQQEPLYLVLVTLDSQHVMAYGKAEKVKPGMALDADILMERRTLLELVFEPLYGLVHHLTTEGGAG